MPDVMAGCTLVLQKSAKSSHTAVSPLHLASHCTAAANFD